MTMKTKTTQPNEDSKSLNSYLKKQEARAQRRARRMEESPNMFQEQQEDEHMDNSRRNSLISFVSHSMCHDENSVTKRNRRNRLEQMKADRDLIAKMELQNMALEHEARTKGLNDHLNAHLNAFLPTTLWKTQPFGPENRDLSPLPRPQGPQKLFKRLNKLTAPIRKRKETEEEHVGDLNWSDPGLRTRSSLPCSEIAAIPTIPVKEDTFDVGRGRSKTTRRNRRVRARSSSPQTVTRSQVQRTPLLQEVRF